MSVFLTYECLELLNIKELNDIKKDKQEELYECKQEKLILISNILSLQSLIAVEKRQIEKESNDSTTSKA
jgi:hypothetical protein